MKSVEPVAMTRLRVEVRDGGRVDERALQAAGAAGTLRVSDTVVHVVVGPSAERLGAALEETLTTGRGTAHYVRER
jgi:phosphotransferase system IIB component